MRVLVKVGRGIKWVEQQQSVYVSSLPYIPLYLVIYRYSSYNLRNVDPERIRLESELNGKETLGVGIKGFGNLRSPRNLSSLQGRGCSIYR